jgi:hypothetical protein
MASGRIANKKDKELKQDRQDGQDKREVFINVPVPDPIIKEKRNQAQARLKIRLFSF